MLDALAPQRRRMVLIAIGLALALVLALAVTAAVRSVARAPHPVRQDQPGPVLLVPGYGGNVDSLAPLAGALRADGRSVRIVAPTDGGTGDLDAEAAHLGQVAADTVRTTGAPSVDVVGYSAGGVVVRLWVRDHGGASVARRVLTLGSPQHGTTQAALGAELAGGCSTACEQLAPDSDLLRRLNAGDETPNGPLWATLRSTSDQVVTPTTSAALDGALNLVVQDYCDIPTAHGELPGSSITAAVLRSVLGVEAPTPPGVAC